MFKKESRILKMDLYQALTTAINTIGVIKNFMHTLRQDLA